MTIVAFETSARPPSVAVRSGGRTESAELGVGRRHASDLLPSLERLLEAVGSTPRGIEVIAVGVGPGSYTGLRVGIATALGLARGTGAALVAVPSVAALAFGCLADGEEGCVLLDARARALYFARYRRRGDELETITAPSIVTAAELGDVLPDRGRLFGDPTVADAAQLSENARARLVTDVVPGARAVLTLGTRQLERDGPTSLDDVEPLYLRAFGR